MKRTLTALTIAATMFASSASAFEANTTNEETNRLVGKPMVGDLAVGVKASIFYDVGCVRNGKVYLPSHKKLETELQDYFSYFEIIKQADGEFTATWGPNKRGEKELPSLYNHSCDKHLRENPRVTFYPVKSVNGFTDRRSFIIDLITKGYE